MCWVLNICQALLPILRDFHVLIQLTWKKLYEIGTLFIFIIQIMIERHREVWEFALDHTAGMENWDLNEGNLV